MARAPTGRAGPLPAIRRTKSRQRPPEGRNHNNFAVASASSRVSWLHMSAMMPLMRVLEQGGKFIQTIKHGVVMNGLEAGPVRAPLKGLNKDDKRALEQVTRVLKRKIADIVAED